MLSATKKLEFFYEISQGLSQSPALYDMLREITLRMSEILKSEIAVVFLYDENTGMLVARQPSLGLDYLSASRLRIGADAPGAIAESYRSAKPVLLRRRLKEGLDVPPLTSEYEIFDLLACPLVSRGRPIGVIVLANKLARRGFSRKDLELAKLLTPHVAVFLDNASLYHRSEEKVAQLTSLIRVVDAINTAPNTGRLYDLTMDAVRGLFAAEKGLINVVNRSTGLMETVRSFGYANQDEQGHVRHPFESIASCYVLERESAFLSGNVAEDKRCPNMVVGEETRSVLCVPVRAGTDMYGIIHMASSYLEAFDEEDALLANAIGEQLGMALESACLFDEINHLAITDGLTGLYNIRQLKRTLGEEVKRSLRYGRPLSFIMLDIDFFKHYNDRHGHLRGDEVLRILAGLLQQNTRDVDTVVRYGGEEFSVIIPEVSRQEAYSMAERIRRVIQDHVFPYEEEQPGGSLTVSIGVASLPADARDGEDLIDKADRALYCAKQGGRNRVCLYEPEMEAHPPHHRIDLSEAENGALRVYPDAAAGTPADGGEEGVG